MIEDFAATPGGAYVLSFVLGIAVGLVAAVRGFRAWLATALVTVVFVVVASGRVGDAPFAAPIYVIVLGGTAVLLAAVDLRDSPLLVGETWWRRVLLVAAHGSVVRRAAEAGDQDRRHLLAARDLVDEEVHVADHLPEGVLDFLHADAADSARNEVRVRICRRRRDERGISSTPRRRLGHAPPTVVHILGETGGPRHTIG